MRLQLKLVRHRPSGILGETASRDDLRVREGGLCILHHTSFILPPNVISSPRTMENSRLPYFNKIPFPGAFLAHGFSFETGMKDRLHRLTRITQIEYN